MTSMWLSEQTCVEETSVPNITVVIPTNQSPCKVLMWSLFSLILRTKPLERLGHFIITINGPDERTGDPSLQDRKQRMLEELRSFSFFHWTNGMPLTIQRTWSRVGHGEALDTAIPWVHTEEYLLAHDDIILKDGAWLEKLGRHYDDHLIFATTVDPVLNGRFNFTPYRTHLGDGYHLGFPHLNTSFLLCKRAISKQLGLTWRGYHVNKLKHLGAEEIQFLARHYGLEVGKIPPGPATINIFSYDIGAWAYHHLKRNNYRIEPTLPYSTTHHFGAVSWGQGDRLLSGAETIDELEKEIGLSPFAEIYNKWK